MLRVHPIVTVPEIAVEEYGKLAALVRGVRITGDVFGMTSKADTSCFQKIETMFFEARAFAFDGRHNFTALRFIEYISHIGCLDIPIART